MQKTKTGILKAGLLCSTLMLSVASAQEADRPWMDQSLDAEARAELVLKEMTPTEKAKLLMGQFGNVAPWINAASTIPGLDWTPPEESRPQSAGFVYGIERLGIPNQWQADAGIGVASQAGPNPYLRTALPSGTAVAATWDRELSYAGGEMIGNEARLSGFNVLLAGAHNQNREPRNGRNFEYAGEDPLLAGVMVGESIRGIQSNNIISTLKHYAFNSQETDRNSVNVQISDQVARETELLSHQIAIEIGDPGSVMCAYNRVNSDFACESHYLLTEVLKEDWGYKGYVMSDWGAMHSTVPAANAGAEQQSGFPFDGAAYYNVPLLEAVDNGHVSEKRFDDMVKRVLWAMFDNGLFDHPVATEPDEALIDFDAHAIVTRTAAEEGMVLLRNEDSILPINEDVQSILVVGQLADKGVISGGGASQVYGRNGNPAQGMNLRAEYFPGPAVFYGSSPLEELRKRTNAEIVFNDGSDQGAAAEAAKEADLVIVIVTQWTGESRDFPLSLDEEGDSLITAVAAMNENTVVVLETGGQVFMPWQDDVKAIVEAWYPGSEGGAAIARVLTGEVNPSGHLPMTFPKSLDQLPRPEIPESQGPGGKSQVSYDIEGAAVGYRWFDKKNLEPLYPFGYGLSYTSFDYSDLTAKEVGGDLQISFTVTNTGGVAGADVPQVYVSPKSGGWESPKHLVAWEKVELAPGQSKNVTVTAENRVLSTFDSGSKTWNRAAGRYEVMVSHSATDPDETTSVRLSRRKMNVRGQ